MDKKIEKKKSPLKRILIGVSVLLGVLVLAYAYRLSLKKTLKLDKDKVMVSQVSYGNFEDAIMLSAGVEPLTTVLVSSSEGGTVAEIYASNGDKLTAGTPLLRIANPNAMLNYTSSQTNITEQINQLRKVRLDLEQNERVLNQDLLQNNYQLETAQRQYNTDTALYIKGVLSKNEFKKSSEDFRYYVGRKGILKKSIASENKSRNMQLQQINASIAQMQESLLMIQKNIENMTIKAPVSGVLSSFDPVVGKSYNSNEAIGKIDVMQGYKLVAGVDEFYINRVREGQTASLDYNGKIYELTVKKVIPEVKSGQFQIELTFSNLTPEGLRRGLSVQAKLSLSGTKSALLLPQGAFYQASNGEWLFVMDKDQHFVRRKVQLGRKNYLYYEVLSGLQKGDQVITSSYDDYKDYDELSF